MRLKLILIIILICEASLFARESVDKLGESLPVHSAYWARTLNRNASTDTDAVYYNPAGLVKLKSGLSLMFSNQVMGGKLKIKDRSTINFDDTIAESAEPVYLNQIMSNNGNYGGGGTGYFVPELNAIYKIKMFAFYIGLGPLGGSGGKLDEGSPTLDWGLVKSALEYHSIVDDAAKLTSFNRNVEIEENGFTFALNTGVAYNVLEWLSLSFGIKYLYSTTQTNAEMKNVIFTDDLGNVYIQGVKYAGTDSEPLGGLRIKREAIGDGYGLVLGINAEPIKRLTIAFRYEYYTPIKMKNNLKTFDADTEIRDDEAFDSYKVGSYNVVFPVVTAFGVSYRINKMFRVESSLTYKWNSRADIGGKEFDYNNSYSTGLAFEVNLFNTAVVSIGYLYNDPGLKEDKITEFSASGGLKNHQFALGGSIKTYKDLEITLGINYTIYRDETVNGAYRVEVHNEDGAVDGYIRDNKERKYSMTMWGIGIGVTYHIGGI